MKAGTILVICFFFCWVILNSCKRELSCENCLESNKPPVANAGKDTIIILPVDSILLNGSASTDPDGKITSYLWERISGPSSTIIKSPDQSKSIVKSLVQGLYEFKVTVTDDGGLSSSDTVSIKVNDTIITNQPPKANAGADQTIALPVNTVSLDGSASTDPDNNIISYAWTKISGQSSSNITNANAVQTQVTNLAEGVYQFELKVTDVRGLFDKDTMQLNVNVPPSPSCYPTNRPIVNAQLIPISTLSGGPVPGGHNEVVFAGNKLVYYNYYYDIIDIYDPTLNTWSTADVILSQPFLTTAPTVIGVGNKVLFAGGEIDELLPSDVVDIYDISTNTWTISHLSTPGMFFSTATCGDKVFFAGVTGGLNAPNNVEIYDATIGSWSTASLSAPRSTVTAFSGNNKVYFTGGNRPPMNQASNVIDIYDNATNTWSTSTMQFPRVHHAGVSVNDILYLAGGNNNHPYYPNNPTICSVETLNTITGNRTLMNLFGPAAWITSYGQKPVLKDNKIIFFRQFGGVDANRFDIYDIQSNTWSIGVLPLPIPDGASAISINNTIYIAGIYPNNQVWKLEF